MKLDKILSAIYLNTKIRYLAVGFLSFVLDFGLLFLLHELVGYPVWVSSVIAFLSSFFFNFFAQKIFSFSSKSRVGRSLIKYVVLLCFNTLATAFVVSLFAETVGWEIGKILATVMITIWNYWAYKYFVYVEKSPQKIRKRA